MSTAVKTANNGQVMTFPYQLEDPTGPMRTCEQYWQNAADAVLSGSSVGRFDIHIYS